MAPSVVIAALLCTALNFLLIPQWGLPAAIAATAAAYLILCLLYWRAFYLERHDPLRSATAAGEAA